MGFMAGFGEGFSRSFEQAQATRAQKEQDAFRLAYSDYVDKKKAYSEADSAWKQAMTKGELMAKKYGLPPEAGLQAAKYIQNGFSDEYVDKLLSQTTYSAPDLGAQPITGTPDAVNSNADTEQPAEASALDQTVASGLAQAPEAITPASTMNSPIANTPVPDPTKQAAVGPQAQAVPNGENVSISDATGQSNMDTSTPAAPADGDILGGMFKPGGVFEHAGESDAEQAARTVRETAGVSEDEFNKIQAGYQAPQIPDDPNFKINLADPKDIGNVYERYLGKGQDLTKASFAGAMAGAIADSKSGDPALMKMANAFKAMAPEIAAQIPDPAKDPDTIKSTMAMLGETGPARKDLAAANDNIITMAYEGKGLIELADGPTLTGVAQGVSIYEGFKREVTSGLDVINQLIQGGASQDEALGKAEQMIAELEANSGGKITADVAQKYDEFTAKMIRYAYSVGKSYGQGGANQSNKEFDIIMKTLQASSDPAVFKNNLQDLIQGKIRAAELQTKSVANSAELTVAMKADPLIKEAVQPILVPISEQLKKDPNLSWVFDPKGKAGDSSITVGVIKDSGVIDAAMVKEHPELAPFIGQRYTKRGTGLDIEEKTQTKE